MGDAMQRVRPDHVSGGAHGRMSRLRGLAGLALWPRGHPFRTHHVRSVQAP
jgi:hypothetical protein